jgi:hypothetical protein
MTTIRSSAIATADESSSEKIIRYVMSHWRCSTLFRPGPVKSCLAGSGSTKGSAMPAGIDQRITAIDARFVC